MLWYIISPWESFFVVPDNSNEDLDVLDGKSKGDGPFPPLS